MGLSTIQNLRASTGTLSRRASFGIAPWHLLIVQSESRTNSNTRNVLYSALLAPRIKTQPKESDKVIGEILSLRQSSFYRSETRGISRSDIKAKNNMPPRRYIERIPGIGSWITRCQIDV